MNELLLVPAGAGAGKTHRIKSELTDWVRSGTVRPDRILAVTFTDAAASELRQRIRASLLQAGLVEGALAVDQAYVSTIHALGLRILTEHALANGSSPMPRLLSDEERDLLLRLEIAHSEPLKRIGANLYRHGYIYDYLNELNAEDVFREQVFNTINLLRNLGHRGAAEELSELACNAIRKRYGPVAPDGAALGERLHKAAAALVEAFPQNLADTVSAKSAKDEFRKNHTALRTAARDRDALDRDWKLWAGLRTLRLSKRGSPTPAGYDDLAAGVMAAADCLVTHPGPLRHACDHVTDLIAGCQQILAGYEERKRELGIIDYTDMIAGAEHLLRADPDVFSAMLGEIDCVIVDEFQDTNPIQFAFLWRLASAAPRTLLVGDVKQAIMGFQGADARLMESLVGANPANVSPLSSNWRSDPRVMDFVNCIGPRLFPDGYLDLAPVRKARAETAIEMLVVEKGRRGKAQNGRPEHHMAARLWNLLSGEATITDRHDGRIRPIETRDIAVLCPTHAMARRYAACLRQLGLPVRVTEEGWHDSPLVMAARYALTYADDPSDRHAALCYSVLGPPRIALQDALAALIDGTLLDSGHLEPLRQLSGSARLTTLPHLLRRAIAAVGLDAWAELQEDPKQARADLLRLEAEAWEFADAHRDMKAAAGFFGNDARVFFGWLQSRLGDRDFDRRPDPGSGTAAGIEIVTWHASKGREWPVVAVAGLDAEFLPRPLSFTTEFPDFSNLDRLLDDASLRFCPSFAAPETQEKFLADLLPAAQQTARRLLYVALTRPRDRLLVEWPSFDIAKLGTDNKGTSTYARILADECGVAPGPASLHAAGQDFAARITHCPDMMPPEFEEQAAGPLSRDYRYGRSAIIPSAPRDPGAPWLVMPSSLETSAVAMPNAIRTTALGTAYDVAKDLFPAATERGTALHQALRVLLQRPDLKARLSAHTGLDDATIELVEQQAKAFRSYLEGLGYDRIACEVPFVHVSESGSTTSAIFDCVAKGPAGIAIIDHKSDPVEDPDARFTAYWPQLAAYAEIASRLSPQEPVTLLGIHWMTRGRISTTQEWRNQ